jgi:hypothetical protein
MLLRWVPNLTLFLNHYQASFCERLRTKIYVIRTRQPHPIAHAEVQPQIPTQKTGDICVKPT